MKYETTVYVCDNPKCRREVVQQDPVERPRGYHGDVLHIHIGGGDSFEWFACDMDCITAAVKGAWDAWADPGWVSEEGNPP